MSDLISRADAICEVLVNDGIDNIVDRINALPSAEAEQEAVPTVVRVTMSDGSQYYLEHERDAIQAEAVSIHEDGTLEVKVPNAQKVGRVLIKDADSHIGGGLFYPDREDGEV